MTDDNDVDVLVLGGGMSGLTTAAHAAERGASVGVVEVARDLGGSAAISGGFVYTAPDEELFLAEDPDGDLARFRVLHDWYDRGFEWLERLGVTCGPVMTGIKTFGVGRQVDIGQYLRRLQVLIESHGGWILRDTRAVAPILEGNRVIGARVRPSGGQIEEVRAANTVIATGGFQASPAWREQFLSPHGAELVVRSNPNSVGDGLSLGMSAAGALTTQMGGYYGHLIPYPIEDFEEPDYVTLAQYHSEHGLLLDKAGKRFVDESRGDHVGTQAVGHRRTALLLIDERVRQDHVLAAYMSGLAGFDKMAEAGKRGAHYATGDSLAQVCEAASAWGYDAAGVECTVVEFNRSVRRDEVDLAPPRKRFRAPIEQPPFAVLEVQSAVTFTYGGLVSDIDDAVLTAEGEPIPGLFVIGADAGGLNRVGYTGGLIRGLILGYRLAERLTPDATRLA